MTVANLPVTTATDPAATIPAPVPSPNGQTTVTWATLVNQLIEHAEPIAEHVGQAAYESFVPMWARRILGEEIVPHYIRQAATALECEAFRLASKDTQYNAILNGAINLVKSAEPKVLDFVIKKIGQPIEDIFHAGMRALGFEQPDKPAA